MSAKADCAMQFTFDKYGGVEIEALPSKVEEFAEELRKNIAEWTGAQKRGLWLKIPLTAASAAAAAAEQGFNFHHALPGYVMMTRWLPTDTESKLPLYGFTQIGVGGVVVNSRGEVLMVQERVSPVPKLQGSWKLPGGLADPGEDFADTVAREVREETGIVATGHRISSLRHSHGYRFGQGDIYVVVVMATAEGASEEIQMDPSELMGARWMAPDEIESRVVPPSTESFDGKVSESNWTVIKRAMRGPTILGNPVHTSRPMAKQPMLYMAEPTNPDADGPPKAAL